MSRKLRRRLIRIALAILPIIVIPQFFYDPLNLRGFDDAYQLVNNFECANDDCTLLRLPTGRMNFGWRWSVTINEDGSRLVPDNPSSCSVRIAGIGDSFVWGPTVNDDETWLNRLAQHFPDACFYNYGQWGYNAEQAAWTLEQKVPKNIDYVIYFIFQNDDQVSYEYHKPDQPPNPFVIVRYGQLIAWRLGWYKQSGWGEEGERDPASFAQAINQMAADPRIHFMGFDGELLVARVENDMGHEVFKIPLIPPSAQVSPIDQHPNAAGHRLIAESLYPLIEEILSR
jgi:hypothetical protein